MNNSYNANWTMTQYLIFGVLREVAPLLDGIHVQGPAHIIEARYAYQRRASTAEHTHESVNILVVLCDFRAVIR